MTKIYVVGIGPGKEEYMTKQAIDIIKSVDVIIGYSVYIELLRDYYPGKNYISTPMTKERERCVIAFEEAMEGKSVAMVCSGDAGVYGMGSLMYEVGMDYPEVEIEMIPGVSAVISGAAVLGAPLIHDFAVISLSDRLTLWELIEKRLRCAADADFVIAIYNPSSKGRPDYLKKACEIILEHRPSDNACGIVRNIGRDGQESKVMTLAELKDTPVDMFTTVFIGNSQTYIQGDKLLTPRGYK